MPGWQQFTERHASESFEVVGIAIDHQGTEAARPYVDRADVTFPILVDDQGVLSARFGFLVVPNGMLIDEQGVVRWAKYGGFSIDNAEDVAIVEQFMTLGEVPDIPERVAPYTLSPADRGRLEAFLQEGLELHQAGDNDRAVASWTQALRIDPKNLTIRKQIWAIEHPDRFHPDIDWDWQRVQLKHELEREIAAGWCGPDGCPISGRM